MFPENQFVKNHTKNIQTALFAQVATNLTSLIILLLGMFYLDSYTFAGIQITLAYLAFCGFMHFGLIDGIELRIAGTELKKKQLWHTFCFDYFIKYYSINLLFIIFSTII